MSKPDPAGGSLEAILASIRKSLAEQSGEAAAEQPRPSSEPEGDAKPARRHGLTERLAGASPSAPQPPHNSDDLSDLLESSGDSPSSTAPSNASPTQAASPAPEDPLWFLSRREEPKPAGSPSLLGLDRDTDAPPPPAEPGLTRPEVLRASMPPFFGSSESTVTPPPAEAPAAVPSGQTARSAPSNAAAAPAVAPPKAPAIEREVSLVAAAAESAASRSAPPSVSGLNGAAGGANAAPGDMASNRALEAVVLELLKPMLRQWLDENMPRLVAQAISDEAVRARLPDGVKKP